MLNRTDDQRNGRKLQDGYRSNRYKGKGIFILNYEVKPELKHFRSDVDVRQERVRKINDMSQNYYRGSFSESATSENNFWIAWSSVPS